ncbi:MAG: MBL fold metallo-hydrolase [Acidimicrobiales bacterium]
MTVTVSTLTCGWLTGSASGFLDGEPGVMRVPVLSFLVEHPKGRVLFDSGLAAELADDTAAAGRMAELFEMDFGRQDAIDRRLSAAEVCEAGDIAVLVNSHLHFDHCGGNALVPNARVVVQAAEWRAGHHEKLVASDTYSPALFDIGQDVQLIDGEHDLFGDGRVVCIPTPATPRATSRCGCAPTTVRSCCAATPATCARRSTSCTCPTSPGTRSNSSPRCTRWRRWRRPGRSCSSATTPCSGHRCPTPGAAPTAERPLGGNGHRRERGISAPGGWADRAGPVACR